MFPSLRGRINRRTFVIGNLLAIGVLFAITILVVIPLAILSLALGSKTADEVISYFYLILILPVLLYYYYFSVLMIKRAHDVGLPGFLIVIVFTTFMLLGRIHALWILNVLGLLVPLFFALKPGEKSRNNFGVVPKKSLDLNDLKINF